ncbi:hypothetical protein HDC36_000840 [Xanthomonas sp. JAI131]|uniref:hypothetical protein n=1 Tax=Xanthomonas sp. JAI131 TaxID=2723067 RepID=UPI0015C76935|nr:hypothetical protein [Xanthomonas sp. JAI131]NYF19403.1 hypothetical protein [Xanthomonas sp. JAI131]
MRDEKDSGTMEMPLPRRRGRPPVGDVAMTPAQRAREYRWRRKDARDAAYRKEVSDAAMIDALRDAMAKGDADYALDLLADLRARVQASKA